VVRLRQRERFRARREDETDPSGEETDDSRRIQFRPATPVGDKRVRPRSVTLMLALFIIVLMAIIFLG